MTRRPYFRGATDDWAQWRGMRDAVVDDWWQGGVSVVRPVGVLYTWSFLLPRYR